MACDPTLTTAPRCRLRRLYTQPGVEVEGYGDDDRVEVFPDAHFVIGRGSACAIRIAGMIGGRSTFSVFWRPPDWTFKVNNEWAIAVVDGERLIGMQFPSRPLHDGSLIELRHVHEEVVIHRLRVEIG